MYTSLIDSFLEPYKSSLSPTDYSLKFQHQLPTLFTKFITTSLTQHLQDINIASPQINFLLFYPYLKDPISQCLSTQAQTQIKQVFFAYTHSLITFWTKSLKQVLSIIQTFQHINLNSIYLNRMVVLYLIQELSNDCEKRIRKNLRASKFGKIEEVNKFVKFVIQRLEVFEWRVVTEEDWKGFDEMSIRREYTEEMAEYQMQVIFGKAYEDLKSMPCQQENGVKGILISDPSQPDKGQYVLCTHQSHILIINSKYLQGWSKFQFDFHHKQISLQLKQSFQSPQSSFITNALTNIGSSLGYLLANMPDRPSKFLQQFFLACTISGSMSVILINIPILGKLILIGGLGYQAADVLQNTDIQTKKKLQKIIGISLSMTVTVTTSIAGAVAGQILIPVPVLGGFIGGVVGGLVGGLSTTAVLNKFQKYKVKGMMQRMKESQNGDGSWELEVVLEIFQLKESFFGKYQEEKMGIKDLVTMFAYFVLTLFESQREQIQIAELEDKCQKKWYRKPTEEDITEAREQIDLIVMDVPEVLLHSEVYFIVHELHIVENIGLLQRMTQQLLGIL